MIAKYSGLCFICGEPTQAGVDMYSLESKKSYHADCEADQSPGPEAYRLADSLGFRHIPWSEVLRVIEAQKGD